MGLYKIPCSVGGHNVILSTDVVNADIPCLISKASMKHAKMVINTFDDTATIYDTVVKLRAMKSGHYFVKLDDYVYDDLLNDDLKHEKVMIEMNENDDDLEKKIKKMHEQLGHPGMRKRC